MRQIPMSERLTRTLKNVKRIGGYVAGVDLVTVKELLGHKSIKMTMRYAHPSTDHKRWAVEVVNLKNCHSFHHSGEKESKAVFCRKECIDGENNVRL